MISGGTFALNSGAVSAVDMLFCASGCEERSTALVRSGCTESPFLFCLTFSEDDNEVSRFNIQEMKKKGATFVDDFEVFFRFEFPSIVTKAFHAIKRPLHVGVDVSSMNRTMIASVLSAIIASPDLVERCTIYYLPSIYSEPKLEFPRTERVGAVIPELSGFDSDPRLPFALAMGLGYEYGVGIGLINQIEPRFTLCLRAVGHDARFEESVRKANLNFDFGVNCEVGEYNLIDPVGAFRLLESICFGLTKTFRLVLVPMGPKFLAAVSVLCSLKYFGTISVWRVVARGTPYNSVPSGEVVLLSVDTRELLGQQKTAQLAGMFFRR